MHPCIPRPRHTHIESEPVACEALHDPPPTLPLWTHLLLLSPPSLCPSTLASLLVQPQPQGLCICCPHCSECSFSDNCLLGFPCSLQPLSKYYSVRSSWPTYVIAALPPSLLRPPFQLYFLSSIKPHLTHYAFYLVLVSFPHLNASWETGIFICFDDCSIPGLEQSWHIVGDQEIFVQGIN